MSSYEYRCKDCGHRFQEAMTMRQHQERSKPSCPKCNSRRTEQVPSAFMAKTSKKT